VKRAALLLLALGAGCEPFPAERGDLGLADLDAVAVLPIVNRTGVAFDGDEFANILASELVKAGGSRVIRPAQIRAAGEPGESIQTANDAIRFGRRVRASIVLACAITDYDPYDPPKVAIATQVLRVDAGPLSGQDLDRLLQSASWRHGPLAMARDAAAHAVAAFEDVYDAQDPETRRALKLYARGRDSAFAGEREFLAVQSRYLQFVSAQLIQRLSSHGS
jgi:hypothetical protein